MRSLILQIVAVTTINLKSMRQRLWLSLSTVTAVALVVMVLLSFLAMADGFKRTIEGAGAPDVAVVLRGGSQSELNSIVTRDQVRLIEEGPGVAKGPDGKPLVSAELYLTVDGIKRSTHTKANLPLRGIGPEGVAKGPDGKPLVSAELYLTVDGIKRSTRTKANLPLRGIGPQGAALRREISIVEGRMFNPGSDEIVVGKALLREFEGFELGKTVAFGTGRWTVVGVFSAGGSVFESEIWADLPVVQSLFKRNNIYQTVRVRLSSAAALDQLKAYSEGDARLKLDVKSEAEYFADQASRTSDLIQKLGWPLAIAMALGALAGALNTMYSSVAARASEIATLRAIGFGGFPAFVGTLVESLILAAIGGAIGAAATYFIFDGFSASTLGASFTQVVFSFHLSPQLIGQGIVLALVVGLAGGVLPAIRAARMPIVAGLYG